MDDVTKNVRHFLKVVKQATGNERNIEAEKTNQKSGPNTVPGKLNFDVFHEIDSSVLTCFAFSVNAITKVILSSRQGPGISLNDF